MRSVRVLAAFLVACFFELGCERSEALDIGAAAPQFSATSVTGETVNLADLKGKTVVLEWFNRHCPFVEKHYKNHDMSKLQEDATGKGVVWITINSTNTGHDDFMDAEKTKEVIKEWGVKSSSFLIDGDGTIGKSYNAKTTPHMFIINGEGKVVYNGAIDDDNDVFGDPKTAKNHVKEALDELAAGKPITVSTSKPYGCSVKY